VLFRSILIQKNYKNKINFIFKDILKNKIKKKYDGIYSLDVFEHIEKKKEDTFIKNLFKILNKKGVLILGTPSLESQKYASKYSKIGHVNCKSQGDLKNLLKKYFPNVFAFSMNDEVIHTGYSKMSHYNFMVCCK
jgi:cyclopropane fatty-acyl-phospholipid synthase-like methyltransferase